MRYSGYIGGGCGSTTYDIDIVNDVVKIHFASHCMGSNDIILDYDGKSELVKSGIYKLVLNKHDENIPSDPYLHIMNETRDTCVDSKKLDIGYYEFLTCANCSILNIDYKYNAFLSANIESLNIDEWKLQDEKKYYSDDRMVSGDKTILGHIRVPLMRQ
ncbi:MAG: hypothetical protein A2X09_14190 [Bacteroidetes bacterium GWF2_43_11]|nr:MAG: hypothetical protein A2X09_14190 [Bacteroidetes bacterium GWF2_43_11]